MEKIKIIGGEYNIKRPIEVKCTECGLISTPKYQMEKNGYKNFTYSDDCLRLCDKCMSKQKSKCCGKEKVANYSDEGTGCYLCQDCLGEFIPQEEANYLSSDKNTCCGFCGLPEMNKVAHVCDINGIDKRIESMVEEECKHHTISGCKKFGKVTDAGMICNCPCSDCNEKVEGWEEELLNKFADVHNFNSIKDFIRTQINIANAKGYREGYKDAKNRIPSKNFTH